MQETPVILCTPRVASRFFSAALQRKTGINIEGTKTHDPNHNFLSTDAIIGIIRDPLDAITSEVAMVQFLKDIPEDHINIDIFIDRYVNVTKKIIEKSRVILVYEDMVKDIDNSVEKVISKVNIGTILNPEYEPFVPIEDRIDKDNGYLVSSKTNKNYENLYKKVSTYNLTEANALYKVALDMSIGQVDE